MSITSFVGANKQVEFISGCAGAGNNSVFTANIGTQDITTDGNGSGGAITLTAAAGANCPGINSLTIIGGTQYAVGDRITIGRTALADASNWTAGAPGTIYITDVQLQVIPSNITSDNLVMILQLELILVLQLLIVLYQDHKQVIILMKKVKLDLQHLHL